MKTGASAEPCAHLQIFMRLSFGRISFLGDGHPGIPIFLVMGLTLPEIDGSELPKKQLQKGN